jgi:hypothetical protein
MGRTRRDHAGSCLCRRVRFEVKGALGTMDHCHCTDCRKSHAAAFATYVEVPWKAFRFLQGESHLATFAAASGTRRSFCRTCGTIVSCWSDADSEGLGIPASVFDTPLDRRPEFHTFVRSRAPWHAIDDHLPQYPTTRDREV